MATGPQRANMMMTADIPNGNVRETVESLQEQIGLSMDRFEKQISDNETKTKLKDDAIRELQQSLKELTLQKNEESNLRKALQDEVIKLNKEIGRMKRKEDDLTALEFKRQQLTTELAELQTKYNCIFQERLELQNQASRVTALQKIVGKSQEEIHKYRSCALNAKHNELLAHLEFRKEMIVAMGKALQQERRRFFKDPEILGEITRLCQELEKASVDFAEHVKILNRAVKEKEEELKWAPDEFSLNLPSLNLMPLPNVVIFYQKLLERIKPTVSVQTNDNVNAVGLVENNGQDETRIPSSLRSVELSSDNEQFSNGLSVVTKEVNSRKPTTNATSAMDLSTASYKGTTKKKFERFLPDLRHAFKNLTEDQILEHISEYHQIVGSFNKKYVSKLILEMKEYILSTRKVQDPGAASLYAKKESTLVEPVKSELCTICLEKSRDENLSEIDCGHRFHRNCIVNWVSKNYSCPNCRAFVLQEEEYPKLPV